MKKFLAATLALTLLGATAASAAPYTRGGYTQHYRGGNDGAAVAAGIGLFALGAILASQHHDYDRDYRYRGYEQGWHGDYDRDRDRRW